jgi:hypothetical protein
MRHARRERRRWDAVAGADRGRTTTGVRAVGAAGGDPVQRGVPARRDQPQDRLQVVSARGARRADGAGGSLAPPPHQSGPDGASPGGPGRGGADQAPELGWAEDPRSPGAAGRGPGAGPQHHHRHPAPARAAHRVPRCAATVAALRTRGPQRPVATRLHGASALGGWEPGPPFDPRGRPFAVRPGCGGLPP